MLSIFLVYLSNLDFIHLSHAEKTDDFLLQVLHPERGDPSYREVPFISAAARGDIDLLQQMYLNDSSVIEVHDTEITEKKFL